MNTKTLIPAVVIGVVVVTGFVLLLNRNQPSAPQPSSSLPVVDASSTPKTTPTSEQRVPNPATCNIGGSVDFTSHNIADNKDNFLVYSGIDDGAREIKWTITPNDGLIIGPNLAASLVLPSGSSQILVALPDKPIAKQYLLRAVMTYGRNVDGVFKIYTARCSGQTTVNLNF